MKETLGFQAVRESFVALLSGHSRDWRINREVVLGAPLLLGHA